MSSPASPFEFPDWSEWRWDTILLFWALHLVAVEVLQNAIVMNVGKLENRVIEKKGKHLDELSGLDKTFIVFNRLCVPLLTYSIMRFTWTNPQHVEWDLAKMNPINTVGSLMGYFLFYDFFYVLFHRLLHVRALYPFVHKHHHRQHAPSRGNVDAVNVHPFEFLTGEFLHLFAIMAIPAHIVAVIVFIAIGGVAASLNHTRFDVRLLNGLYEVRAHDVHHRIPQTNYGQYIMIWDKIMGSFRSYEATSKGSKSERDQRDSLNGAQEVLREVDQTEHEHQD